MSSFDSWAIVEIFGHQTFAGRVTEQAIGGASFVRVDGNAICVPVAAEFIRAFSDAFSS